MIKEAIKKAEEKLKNKNSTAVGRIIAYFLVSLFLGILVNICVKLGNENYNKIIKTILMVPVVFGLYKYFFNMEKGIEDNKDLYNEYKNFKNYGRYYIIYAIYFGSLTGLDVLTRQICLYLRDKTITLFLLVQILMLVVSLFAAMLFIPFFLVGTDAKKVSISKVLKDSCIILKRYFTKVIFTPIVVIWKALLAHVVGMGIFFGECIRFILTLEKQGVFESDKLDRAQIQVLIRAMITENDEYILLIGTLLLVVGIVYILILLPKAIMAEVCLYNEIKKDFPELADIEDSETKFIDNTNNDDNKEQ